MPSMWEPPHKHARPTSHEAQLVEECIQVLEVQLQNARGVLLWAQQNVAILQRHIEERRAWLAPVRHLPYDILSMIFLNVCQMQWWAPLDIGQVCQKWRETIHATPKAWSYMPLEYAKSPKLQELFLKNSVPFNLHVDIPDKPTSRTHTLIAQVADRIDCLHISQKHYNILQDRSFSELRRLRFHGAESIADDTDTGCILNADMFPKLRFLWAHTIFDTIPWTVPPFPNLVALQDLRIIANNPDIWTMIVDLCSHSLKILSIYLQTPEHETEDEPKTIIFPNLEYFAIHYINADSPAPWPINARTPVLQAYTERLNSTGTIGPIHQDTETVVSLDYLFHMDLSMFPQVQQINFCPFVLSDNINMLYDNPDICPNLTNIVDDLLLEKYYEEGELERAKQKIATRNQLTGGNIRFGPERLDGVFGYNTEDFVCKWCDE